jgi:hypothetical protein
MFTIDKIKALMKDLESDRVERTNSFREDKLGPAACAFSNDFPNYIGRNYFKRLRSCLVNSALWYCFLILFFISHPVSAQLLSSDT